MSQVDDDRDGSERTLGGFPLPSLTGRAVLVGLLATALLLVIVYFLVPRLAGLEDTWRRVRGGSLHWLAVAVVLESLSYLGYAWNMSAVSAAGGVVLGVKRSTQITLAGTAATRLLATGGAGGIAVTTWALSRAGHGPRRAAEQVSSQIVATYGVFMLAVVSFGTALAVAGAPPLLSAVPAVIAALAIALFAVATQAPDAIARRLGTGSRWRRRLLAAPQALADGTRLTIDLIARRELGLLGAVAWWAFDIATLWACFWAFGDHPFVPELVMAYFLGQVGNLLPLPGGVGGVEGGMVGACAAFGMDAEIALLAVLAYRGISVWVPALPGLAAILTLRRAANGTAMAEPGETDDLAKSGIR